MKIKKSETERLNYACGMNASSVKKMCRFIFGEYFYDLKINTEDRMFDIYMYEVVGGVKFTEKFEKDYIDYFKEYWDEVPGFKLKYFKGLHTSDL